MLASLGSCWWQHIFIRGLNELCIAVVVTRYGKKETGHHPAYNYVCQILPYPSNCAEDL
jgi:hypothetical protein